MFELRQTDAFARWFGALRDATARKLVARRLALLQTGQIGDARASAAAYLSSEFITARDTGSISRATVER